MEIFHPTKSLRKTRKKSPIKIGVFSFNKSVNKTRNHINLNIKNEIHRAVTKFQFENCDSIYKLTQQAFSGLMIITLNIFKNYVLNYFLQLKEDLSKYSKCWSSACTTQSILYDFFNFHKKSWSLRVLFSIVHSML